MNNITPNNHRRRVRGTGQTELAGLLLPSSSCSASRETLGGFSALPQKKTMQCDGGMCVSRRVHALRALLITGEELPASPRHGALQRNGAFRPKGALSAVRASGSATPQKQRLHLLLTRWRPGSPAGALTGWCDAAAGAPAALRWDCFSGQQSQC